MITYCQLDHQDHISMKFDSKLKHCHPNSLEICGCKVSAIYFKHSSTFYDTYGICHNRDRCILTKRCGVHLLKLWLCHSTRFRPLASYMSLVGDMITSPMPILRFFCYQIAPKYIFHTKNGSINTSDSTDVHSSTLYLPTAPDLLCTFVLSYMSTLSINDTGPKLSYPICFSYRVI